MKYISTGSNGIKIEPYWNVNVFNVEEEELDERIKIEPYWNVNVDIDSTKIFKQYIKIEPYWNVNSYMSIHSYVIKLN